jgi:hypothetical protein
MDVSAKALTPALSQREREEETLLTLGLLTLMKEIQLLISPHTQGVGHAIDVVEPRRDQCDLQDSLIIKTNPSQPLMI